MANIGVFLDLVENIKKQAWDQDGAKIDNVAQRLNYRVTTCLLLLFSILLSFHGWFSLDDRPVECITGSDMKTRAHFEQYCWMHPMNVSLEKEMWEEENFEKHLEGIGKVGKEDKIHQFTYYQWGAFFFLMQAAYFAAPRLLWRGLEGGAMDALVKAVEKAKATKKETEMKVNEAGGDAAARWLDSRKLRGVNSTYAAASIFCELLYGLNIFVQWWMTDRFLGRADTSHWGEVGMLEVRFLNLGILTMTNRTRPLLALNILFPKQISCTLSTFGSGGADKETTALCLLPLNVMQDKLFLCYWFWLVAVSVVTYSSLIYRIVMLTSEPFRRWKLEQEVMEGDSNRRRMLCRRKPLAKEDDEAKLRRQGIHQVARSHADFFIFETFRRNCPALDVKHAILRLKNNSE